MQYASECRMPAGSRSTGRGATSQSKSVDRPERRGRAARGEEHRQPAVGEARLVVLGLAILIARASPRNWLCKSRNCWSAASAAGRSSAKRVGCPSSSTSSPPPDHTNGASLMTLGSMARPNTAAWPAGRRRVDGSHGRALRVERQRGGALDHVLERPTRLRLGHVVALEQVAVEVHDEARDVLWQTGDSTAASGTPRPAGDRSRRARTRPSSRRARRAARARPLPRTGRRSGS